MKNNLIVLTLCLALASCGGKETKQESKQTAETADDKAPKTADDKAGKDGEKNTEDKAVVIAKSGLSLRAEPNPKGKLVKLLPTNAVVKVLEKGEEGTFNGKKAPWYKVQHGKQEGYAFGGFLQMGGQVKATGDASAQTAGEGAETTNFADVQQKGLVTAKSGLTLRKAPNASAASVTVIPQNQEVGILEFLGEEVEIQGMHGVWCKVRYGKKEGYLFSAYINFSTATISAKSGLTLRDSPSKQGKQITVIPTKKVVYLLPPTVNEAGEVVDETVHTDDDGNVWYKVRYGKYEGWAFGQFLEIEGGC